MAVGDDERPPRGDAQVHARDLDAAVSRQVEGAPAGEARPAHAEPGAAPGQLELTAKTASESAAGAIEAQRPRGAVNPEAAEEQQVGAARRSSSSGLLLRLVDRAHHRVHGHQKLGRLSEEEVTVLVPLFLAGERRGAQQRANAAGKSLPVLALVAERDESIDDPLDRPPSGRLDPDADGAVPGRAPPLVSPLPLRCRCEAFYLLFGKLYVIITN